MTEEVAQWLKKAADDIGNAQFLYDHRWPRPLELICFLCQQCAKKALKAYWIFQGEEPPRTHDVAFLYDKCASYSHTFHLCEAACKQLTPYAVHTRYPHNIEITDEETVSALQKAKQILEIVNNQVI